MKCNLLNIPKKVILKENPISKTFTTKDSSCLNPEPCLKTVTYQYLHNFKFLADLDYKQQLLKSLNIPNITALSLTSILGPIAFKNFIEENNSNPDIYRPGIRPAGQEEINDSYPLTNVENRTFGANLHIHTTDSDGEMSVEELLNQATKYADLYVKKNNKPFVIAITDHNTISSCKKALEIIAKNPNKFKNLRVVLGTEISTKEDSIYDYKLKKPEKFHILALCIDPFEEKLNNFLNYMNEGRKNPMNPKTVTVEDVVTAIENQPKAYLSYAHPAFPDLKHRITNPNDDYCKLNQDCVKFFVEKAGKKALYAETYYGGYCGTMATDDKLHQAINEAVEKYGLKKAGGLDTHGNCIFYNGQKIKQKKKKSI